MNIINRKNSAYTMFFFGNLLLALSPLQAMELPKGDTGKSIKTFLKSPRGIASACYALLIGHAGYQLWNFSRSGKAKDMAYWDGLENASEPVSAFVRDTLREQGIPQEKIDLIKIKNREDWEAAYTHIAVPNEGLHKAFSAASDDYPLHIKASHINWTIEDEDCLTFPKNTWKGLLLHEYGHVYSNDYMHYVQAPYIAPLIAYGLLGGPHRLITKVTSLSSCMEHLLAHMLRLDFAYKVAPVLVVGYKKYREHHADKFAIAHCNDPQIIQDKAKLFVAYHTQDKFPDLKGSVCQRLYSNNMLFRELYDWWKWPNSCHLSHLTRANYFYRQADMLRREQQGYDVKKAKE